MPKAFVAINVELGMEEDVLKRLKSIPNVEEAYRVFGVYDTIVKVKATTMEELRSILTERVRRLQGVRSTLTMIVMDQAER